MRTLTSKKRAQTIDESKLGILHFNDLIREQDPAAKHEIESIDTFSTCGFELLVASSNCEHPLITCITILMEFAYSDSIEALCRDGRVVINVDQNSWNPMVATLILRPKECLDIHWLVVINGQTAYLTLPSYSKWSSHGGKGFWLYDRLVGEVGWKMPPYAAYLEATTATTSDRWANTRRAPCRFVVPLSAWLARAFFVRSRSIFIRKIHRISMQFSAAKSA